jgi:hypothetical protein
VVFNVAFDGFAEHFDVVNQQNLKSARTFNRWQSFVAADFFLGAINRQISQTFLLHQHNYFFPEIFSEKKYHRRSDVFSKC